MAPFQIAMAARRERTTRVTKEIWKVTCPTTSVTYPGSNREVIWRRNP